jgi:Flp pilus assembly protein TadB
MFIIVGSTFFTTLLFVMALVTTKQETSLSNRLHGFTVWRSPQTVQSSAERKNIRQVLSKLANLAPRQLSKKLDKQLLSASIPLSGGEFIVLQFLLTITFCLISILITHKLIISLGIGFFGYILPRIWLKRAQINKKNKFNDQLIDALLIIANSLKAGFSFLQAMDLVSKEMTDPIAGELQFCLRDMNYGTPTEEALQNLSDRVGCDDLDLLITAILIQRQVGGNLAEVLQNIHSTLQDRIRIKREIKTLTAQGKISGYIIAALPFGIAAVLLMLNPEYMKLLISDKIGWGMIAGGLTLEVIGFLIIRKIISIKV